MPANGRSMFGVPKIIVPVGVHCLKVAGGAVPQFLQPVVSFKKMLFIRRTVMPAKVVLAFTRCARPANCSAVEISNTAPGAGLINQAVFAVPFQTAGACACVNRCAAKKNKRRNAKQIFFLGLRFR